LIDPKIQTCNICGNKWKPKIHHKIWMLIHGEYTRKCPQCGAILTYKLIHHVVKINSTKILNERIWENG